MAFNIPAGGSAKTKTPSITIVDNTSGVSVDFTLTNNDANEAVLVYEIGDTFPDANSIKLATSTTSGTLTLSGLSDNTSYTIYCYGTTADKVQSVIQSLGFTTPKIVYYELLGDTEVTGSAVTSVTFSSLSISKTDDLVLIGNIDNTSASNAENALYFNNNQVQTNYYQQYLNANNTSVSAGRFNGTYFATTRAGESTYFNVKIKLTNDGYLTLQADNNYYYDDPSTMELRNNYITSTFTGTTLTQIDIVATVANGIGIGSRFFLYKVVA